MPSLVPASMSTKIKGAAFWSRCTRSVARSSLLFKRFRFCRRQNWNSHTVAGF